ncbi:hypothetical protein A6R68_02878, partial [Neotoma lepida]
FPSVQVPIPGGMDELRKHILGPTSSRSGASGALETGTVPKVGHWLNRKKLQTRRMNSG